MSDNIKKVHNAKSDNSSDQLPKAENNKTNYFSSLADKYLKVSHILYIALAVCFILTLLFNAKLLTYNNFSYLVKDFNAAIDLASENYNSISYTHDELRVSKNFRGGMITASTTDMAIYTATGKKTLQMNETFIAPEIAVSQKYAIIYDLGGKNYSIYNSFARVHHNSSKFPISFITVSENGWYAIVSKDNEHNSIVYLYNDDFKLKKTYYYDYEYVFSVSIDDKASSIAIATAEADNAGDKFSTFVDIYDIKSKKGDCIASVKLGAGLPCASSFNNQGIIQVVCTDGIYSLEADTGNVKKHIAFSSGQINKVSIGEYGCAVVIKNIKEPTKNTILVFDKNGEQIYNTDISNGIFDIELFEENIFVNQNDSILKINIKNGKKSVTPNSDKGFDIIIYNNSNILLCCQTKAKYIKL